MSAVRFSLKDLPPGLRRQARDRLGKAGGKPAHLPAHLSSSAGNPDGAALLREAVRVRFPDARFEYRGVVPGRRFRADIAFPEARLAVEFDGWQHHGKTKGAFQRDRLRQNLMVCEGWRVLRFFHAQVAGGRDGGIEGVLEMIGRALDSGPGGLRTGAESGKPQAQKSR